MCIKQKRKREAPTTGCLRFLLSVTAAPSEPKQSAVHTNGGPLDTLDAGNASDAVDEPALDAVELGGKEDDAAAEATEVIGNARPVSDGQRVQSKEARADGAEEEEDRVAAAGEEEFDK